MLPSARSLSLVCAPRPRRRGWIIATTTLAVLSVSNFHGPRHEVAVAFALVNMAIAVMLALPRRERGPRSARHGHVTTEQGTLAVRAGQGGRRSERRRFTRGAPGETLWSLRWSPSELASGHIEDDLDRPSTAVVVVTSTRGDQLRATLHSRGEVQGLLSSLDLDAGSRAVRFALDRPDRMPALDRVVLSVGWLASLAGSVLALLALGHALLRWSGPASACALWASFLGLCALILFLFEHLLRPTRVWLTSAHDGLLLPDGQYLPWASVARVARTARGLRLTSGQWSPVDIDLQPDTAPPLRTHRANPTTPTAALREAILRTIEQHRRLTTDAPPPATAPDATAVPYRADTAPVDSLWATLVDGHAPPAARVAAAEALAKVAPPRLATARRRLAEPTVTRALDRLL